MTGVYILHVARSDYIRREGGVLMVYVEVLVVRRSTADSELEVVGRGNEKVFY